MPITLNRHSDNLLSSAKKLSDVFNDIRELSEERIYSIPSDEFLAMETQEIAESILDDYKIELLSLQDAHVSAPEEQGIDFIVRQTIPFTGDAVLLRSKANRSLDPPPSGHIKKENEDEHTIEVLLNIPGALLDKPIDI